MSASAANAEFSAKVRKASHKVTLDANTEQPVHPFLDNNSFWNRTMQTTGYRPTPEDFINRLVNDVRALTPEDLAVLQHKLQAAEAVGPLNS